MNATEAEWQRIQRGMTTLSLTLAMAKPELVPQSLVRVSGFKDAINATDWRATRVTSVMDDAGGYTQSVELELGAGV